MKLQKDFSNGEVQANASSSDARNIGPCFNCEGKHFSRDCTRAPVACYKCHKQGHLAEYCERVQTHNSNWSRVYAQIVFYAIFYALRQFPGTPSTYANSRPCADFRKFKFRVTRIGNTLIYNSNRSYLRILSYQSLISLLQCLR
jgi:hypothetical protein